jgi:hypothetical protein
MAQYHGVNTEFLSAGNNNYYEQQTFLGLSISSFNAQGGVGDTSSTVSIDLVRDEFNASDATPSGTGHDVYWDVTKGDLFAGIPVGSPVFFAFGVERAEVKTAFLSVLDKYGRTVVSTPTQYYKDTDTAVKNGTKKAGEYKSGTKGHYHFKFGGILQAYNQTLAAGGSSAYQVKLTDAREILSDVTLILNGYTGDSIGISNIMNVYGLLEHNPVDSYLREKFEPDYYLSGATDILPQNSAGLGTDMFYADESGGVLNYKSIPLLANDWINNIYTMGLRGDVRQFPITGTGFSRRNATGIPYYRVVQGINTLLGLNKPFTQNYAEYNPSYQGWYYGTRFRGLKYALDITSLPYLSYTYMLNYDQMSLLEFAMEVCEAANHELIVDLIPILDHPYTQVLYNYNQSKIGAQLGSEVFVGVIKMSSIDKSVPSTIGNIQAYLNTLPQNIEVHSKDLGYELSNETLDKLIVGANEVDMYIFPNNIHEDFCAADEMQTNYQIIPYYGTINGAATIPKGVGSYSQILLDASNLFAEGVGDTYVATELELRAAAISYEKWVEFLLQYNNLYMESIEQGDIRDIAAATTAIAPDNADPIEISDSYKITVPRCVWPTPSGDDKFVNDEPNNPCHPPYGWPLYWHRARNIGIPQAGMAAISLAGSRVINEASTNFGANVGTGAPINAGRGRINPRQEQFVKRATQEANAIMGQANYIGRAGLQNARTIHSFLKKIADEYLGKKWLVKIPQRPNYHWKETYVQTGIVDNKIFTRGPFGFPPRNNKGNKIAFDDTNPFALLARAKARAVSTFTGQGIISQYLNPAPESTLEGDPAGALKIGLVLDEPGQLSFNYYPEPQGGWYPHNAMWSIVSQNMGVLPEDFAFLKNENGRIAPYVRFNNSENLDFSSISAGEMSKQKINLQTGKIQPDFINRENSYMEGARTARDIYPPQRPASVKTTRMVHFVKVDLAENYVIAPKFRFGTRHVYGRSYSYTTESSEPRKVFDPEDCKEKDSYRLLNRFYYPIVTSGQFPVKPYIDLDDPATDPRNGVYAVITVPGKVAAHVSSSFREGMDMNVQNVAVKHILQADVVRGVVGFDLPPINDQFPQERFWAQTLHPSGLSKDARALIRKGYEGLTFSTTHRLNIASPSPVYPDLVVLPLRSEERCYGPWSSISTDGANYFLASGSQIGGKVEFVKDENLAPWNFGGYTFMSQQGIQSAMLGTSANILTERGAFSVAGVPSGLSLFDNLYTVRGPIITDISISFDATGAAKTNYRLDSYTVSFGKMQKQRSDQIKKLSRLRQQMWDQRNKEVRRRSGKNQTDGNFNAVLKGLEGRMNMLQYNVNMYKQYENRDRDYSIHISRSVTKARDLKTGNKYNQNLYESAFQTGADMLAAAQSMSTDFWQAAHSFYNTASSKPEDSHVAASNEPHRGLGYNKSRPDYPHPNRPDVDEFTSSWHNNIG